MNTKPLIGITARHENNTPNLVLRRAYVNSIVNAGGVPLLLPILPVDCIDSLLTPLDGLVLTGGEDVNPLFYNELPDRCLGPVDHQRDVFELELTRRWLALGKPLLGICRGIQTLNVAAGGSLYQDLPSHLPNAMRHGNNGPRGNLSHEVLVEPGSLLSQLLEPQGSVLVNSIHHQAIKEVAEGFRVAAVAKDGVIEAIEAANGAPVLGVQWHPEELACPLQYSLFRNFVKLCSQPNAEDAFLPLERLAL